MTAGDVITRFNRISNPNWEQILEESALNLNRPITVAFNHKGETRTGNLTITVPPNTEFGVDDVANVGLIPQMDPGPINVLSVAGGTPADRAGPQGRRPARHHQRVPTSLSLRALLAYLKDNKGAADALGILRNGQPLTLTATPEKMETPGAGDQYRLGFTYRPPPADIERLPVGEAMKQSLKDNREGSMLILRVIKGLFTRHVAVNQMMGPVGMAQQIDIATQMVSGRCSTWSASSRSTWASST